MLPPAYRRAALERRTPSRCVPRFGGVGLPSGSVGPSVDGIDADDAQPRHRHTKQAGIGVSGGNGRDRYADRKRDDAEDELPRATRLITSTGRVRDLGFITQLPCPEGGQLLNPLREPLRDVFGVLRTELHPSGQCGLSVARRFLAGSMHGVWLPRRVRRLLLVSPLRLLLVSPVRLLLIFPFRLLESLTGLLLISGLRLRPLLIFGLRLRPLLISGLRRMMRVVFAVRWRLPWSGLHRLVGL
jgi:hypothetical protein